MKGRHRLVTLGVVIMGLALLGWLGTLVTAAFVQHPRATEDLTPAWTEAEHTPLGSSAVVRVPARQTLVAFLVGTHLYGTAGTTGGTCTGTADHAPVSLGWPVYINRSLTDLLEPGRETVAIAGWRNDTDGPITVEIHCTTTDSTVDYFVAVPTRTAVIAHRPWFQPWAWAALGATGAAFVAAGISRPSR